MSWTPREGGVSGRRETESTSQELVATPTLARALLMGVEGMMLQESSRRAEAQYTQQLFSGTFAETRAERWWGGGLEGAVEPAILLLSIRDISTCFKLCPYSRVKHCARRRELAPLR